MASTFFGLGIAKSGLFVSQRALNVVSHNVANANTPGYSRQRLDSRATSPEFLPAVAGALGTGVDSEAVKQIRDAFLDFKVRTEMTTQGEWEFKKELLGTIETIFNEPSDSGLRSIMDMFFQSVHELNKNPESLTARALVRQRAVALSQNIGGMYGNLVKLQKDIDFQLQTVTSQVNGYAEQIRDLNRVVYLAELDGSKANDIRDQRNLVIDQLSKLVNVDYFEDNQGRFSVLISGKPIVSHYNIDKITLTERLNKKHPDDAFKLYDAGWESGSTFRVTSGEMKAIFDMRDGIDAESKGIPYYVEKLNEFTDRFFTEVNRIHMGGYDLDGKPGLMMFTKNNMSSAAYEQELKTTGLDGKPPIDLTSDVLKGTSTYFTKEQNNNVIAENIKLILLNNPNYKDKSVKFLSDGRYYLVDRIPANQMTVSSDIDADLDKIAASATLQGLPGDGANALLLANMRKNVNMFTWGSPDDYVKSLVANLGVDSAEAIRLEKNQKAVIVELENKRQAIMGVSLDEEMADMIRYQHSYSANARVMTTMDELLDIVVNRLGLVGR